MLIKDIFGITLLILILGHTIYDYLTIEERNLGNDFYVAQSGLKRGVMKILLPIAALIAIPTVFFNLFTVEISEHQDWIMYFLLSIFFAFSIGPSLVHVYFRNFKAAGLGFSIRLIAGVVFMKWGW